MPQGNCRFTSALCDKHGLPMDRHVQGPDRAGKPKAIEHLNRKWAQTFAANFVSGKTVLLEERDIPSRSRQQNAGNASCRASPENDRSSHTRMLRGRRLRGALLERRHDLLDFLRHAGIGKFLHDVRADTNCFGAAILVIGGLELLAEIVQLRAEHRAGVFLHRSGLGGGEIMIQPPEDLNSTVDVVAALGVREAFQKLTPHSPPNCHVPDPMTETRRPVLPRIR